MITVDRAYEEKQATLILDISTGKPMTKEEAFKYYGDNLNEYVLTYYLLKVYNKSKIYDDISILEYDTVEFHPESFNREINREREQDSIFWQAYVEVEFLAYLDCPSNTYLDRASFERNL